MRCRPGAGTPASRPFCTRKVEMTGRLMPYVALAKRDIAALSLTSSGRLVAGHLPGTRPRREEASVKIFNIS